MRLRDLINRLEYLSDNGQNDNLDVCIRNAKDFDFPFGIECAHIANNFDVTHEGLCKWIQIETYENLCDYGDGE